MIVVTGASGLLGANLVLEAQGRGEEVAAIYNQHSFVARGVRSVQADLTNENVVFDRIHQLQPHWIIHCAASTNVDWCEEHRDEAYQINAEMTRNLARGAKMVGARLVYISTDSVFDGKADSYVEQNAPAPLNVYADSKLAGEVAVQEELDSSLIVRTNIYGWNVQDKLSLAEWVLNRLESGQNVPGFEDVVFTPILVNDLSEAILDLMEHPLTGVYHIAGSEACSKYHFALQIAEVFALSRELVQPVSVDDVGLQAPRPKNISLQTGKVSQALGRPMPGVEAGLQRFKYLRDSGYVNRLKALEGGHQNVKIENR